MFAQSRAASGRNQRLRRGGPLLVPTEPVASLRRADAAPAPSAADDVQLECGHRVLARKLG
jgi:hypothetical protein